MRYIAVMAMKNGITVRLDETTRARLDDIAERAGVKPSMLMRRAIMDYVAEAERTGRANFILEEPAVPYGKKKKSG